MPVSRSQWNDGYGADSALPEATVVGVLSALSRRLSPRCDVARNDQSVTRAAETSHVKLRDGAPGEIRTPDPQIRSLVLYPAELRALGLA